MELTLPGSKENHTIASFIPSSFPGPLFIQYSGARETGTVIIKNLGNLRRGCYRPLTRSHCRPQHCVHCYCTWISCRFAFCGQVSFNLCFQLSKLIVYKKKQMQQLFDQQARLSVGVNRASVSNLLQITWAIYKIPAWLWTSLRIEERTRGSGIDILGR